MKCNICDSKVSNGFLVHGTGFVCSDDCCQIANGRRKAYHDELRKEPIGEMPAKLETADFERWTLKFAIQWLDTLTPAMRKKLGKANPMLLIPEELSLDFKEKIIRYLHRAYVSEVEHKGHDRLFSGGTYCFRQPVPQEVIIEAAKKADLIQ